MTVRTAAIVLGFSTILLAAPTAAAQQPVPAGDGAMIVECRFTMDADDFGSTLELRITNPQLIQKVLSAPLAAAKPDPKPRRYPSLGQIRFKRKDGTEEGLHLFKPWGHYKHDGDYYIADLEPLRKAVKEAMDACRRYNKLD